MNDVALLQAFARQKSEAAFQQLVRRHGKLVYSCARQRVSDPHAAEDIAQSVFLALAIKAPSLPADIILAGWLYRATQFAAAKYQRAEQSRREREMKAHQDPAIHEATGETTAVWQEIQPHLAEALDGLSATDWEAVLLRFYNDLSYRQVGQSLRITEEAAKKRVLRAVERVRRFLAKRGVRIGAGALAATLGAQAAEAMPVTVAAQTLKTALALGSGTMASTATSTLMLAKGALKAMFIAKVQTVTLTAAACLIVAGAGAIAARQLTERSTTGQPEPIAHTPVISPPAHSQPSFGLPEPVEIGSAPVASADSPSTATDVLPSNAVLSVSVSSTNTVQFGDPRAIEIAVTYSNQSEVVAQIDMGSLRAEFVDEEYTDMFDQIVMAMPARVFETVTLDPGREYRDVLILVPKRGSTVPPGKFRVRILSHIRRHSATAVEVGEVIFEIK